MAFKIAVFGVRDNEVPYFHDLNKYNYDLTLVTENLSLANVDKVDGHDAVLARANCALQADMLQKLSEHGIKYVFTRTVGHNHIDLHVTVAYVPSYSPYAVAELAFTLALMQQRQTTLAVANAAKGQF